MIDQVASRPPIPSACGCMIVRVSTPTRRNVTWRVPVAQQAGAQTAVATVPGFNVGSEARWGDTPQGWAHVVCSKEYDSAPDDTELFGTDVVAAEDALREAGIEFSLVGTGVVVAGGTPDSRWVVAVNRETGEQYGKVVGRDREEALRQLSAVSAFYGVPIELLDVLPPID